jgi:cobalt-zinc-cadmium efflux system protein
MPHDHSHSHHLDRETGDRRVLWAVVINLALTVVQVVAGIVSGSLALIADGVHNLADAMSLVIAFAARKVARRPSDGGMTFGYGRIEVVAAMINYTTLIVIALYLASEAVMRFADPPGVEGWIVVAVAGVALVIDTGTALLTWRLSKESLNIRAAFLHNLTDALGSVAVIVAGSLILLYDWRLIDPIVTLGIAGYILWLSISGIVPVARILMQGTPEGIETEAVCAAIEAVPGVGSVHHLHLWQMDERAASLEAHVVLEGGGMDDAARVKGLIRTLLHKRFGISHATLETELPAHSCADAQRIGHADA